MKQAIAYIRVSTKDQGANGVGLGLQLEQIRAFASASRISVTEVFQDVDTGTGEAGIYKRNGLQRAILKARELNCPIIVSNVDRLTRSSKAMADFIADEGIKVIAASHGKKSKAVLVGEAARGQMEAQIISERTRAALSKKKAEGVPLGNRTNLPDARAKSVAVRSQKSEARAENLRPVVAAILASGTSSYRGIAEALASRGVPSPRGGEWSPSAIKRLLAQIADRGGSALSEPQAEGKPCEAWGTW
ncbi:recombinase family protein [Magnetospirillum moscoviense]|uniref:Resolvase/invertase-type recombinase catalytic domain-containing protein n=1 Tax=Magnetospirillum moscoviense TaxID=1437059 RepID=A0A178MKW4_9PROT|nr:recombinase family protein [Magnetospirillum moscoviense]OAN48644.1 hypothetical protein A6A05_14935 [Magnetospirillum moscoviense]